MELTGPVNTVFDLDDQVPVRDVTLLSAFVNGAKQASESAKENAEGNSIFLWMFPPGNIIN